MRRYQAGKPRFFAQRVENNAFHLGASWSILCAFSPEFRKARDHSFLSLTLHGAKIGPCADGVSVLNGI
jgi:hypothetical protein